jgi:hypothetical protein
LAAAAGLAGLAFGLGALAGLEDLAGLDDFFAVFFAMRAPKGRTSKPPRDPSLVQGRVPDTNVR